MLVVAALVLRAGYLLPAALTIALVGLIVSAGVDNYASILFPTSHADPRRGASGARGRGLGAMVMSFLLLGVTLLLAAPFLFLAWLPLLLGRPAVLARHACPWRWPARPRSTRCCWRGRRASWSGASRS